jgi:hypothetical protein
VKAQGFLLLLFLASFVAASEVDDLSYDCVIKKVYDVGDAGMLKESGFQKQFVGNKFSVSRETGKIVGQTLTTVLAKNIRVINSGSKENSFKSIAEFEGQIQLIEIQLFKKSIKKPFVATSMGGAGIVTGICE